MQSIKFKKSITINQSSETIFDFTQDYQKRLNWDTFLIKADLINGATAADKGVKAYCVAHNGMGMETEYLTFLRPKVTAIKMTKGPYLFKSFLASWKFKSWLPTPRRSYFYTLSNSDSHSHYAQNELNGISKTMASGGLLT